MMDFAFLFNAELWLWSYQDSFSVWMVTLWSRHDISEQHWFLDLSL